MTDPAIIAASYAAERNYSHNPDDVIDAPDAVGVWGTAKESTTKLVDLSGNNNIADIHDAMPTEGFIQGRRFTAANKNYLDCGNDSSLDLTEVFHYSCLCKTVSNNPHQTLFGASEWFTWIWIVLRGSDLAIRCNLQDVIVHATFATPNNSITRNEYIYIDVTYDKNAGDNNANIYINGIIQKQLTLTGSITATNNNVIIGYPYISDLYAFNGIIAYSNISPIITQSNFNTIARLPFWSVNYTDYPNNVVEYTENLPYSSSIISSGTFKVDDDKLQCVSAGTMTYSASYNFDGSEFVKVTIDGVEYAGTGTITHENTTVSVAQGNNKITIQAGTGDTIDKVYIQFREEVS